MARLIVDTNIFIDFFKGEPQAKPYVASSESVDISIITWIELMSGLAAADGVSMRAFLETFHPLQLTPRVADEAAKLRRERRLKLPDAVIWATARVAGARLVTRNTRDFPADDPGVIIPYTL